MRSFEFFADRPVDVATGNAAGRIICKELQFVFPISRASPILLSIFFNNENIVTAELTCYRAGPTARKSNICNGCSRMRGS